MNYQEFSALKTQVHTGEITAATAMDMMYQRMQGAVLVPEAELDLEPAPEVPAVEIKSDAAPAADHTEDQIPVLNETIEDFKPKDEPASETADDADWNLGASKED